MANSLKNNTIKGLFVLLAGIALAACGGGGSSSSTPTSPPNYVSVYYSHNLVFKNNTTLATGYNGFGQLGTGNLGNRNTAGTLKSYYPFSGAATGGDHSVAFINNSTVRSWGYNGYGQLGNATTTYSSIPVRTGNLHGVTAVAAGVFHSLALKSDGTVWAWGSNTQGQLGAGSAVVSDYSTIPVQVGWATTGVPLTNIQAIAANGYDSLALANGNVWAWGFNESGQLSIDPATTGASAAPIQVQGLPAGEATAIAAGAAFNYAVVNGEVWAWGNNDTGQLGDGTAVSKFTPVRVLTAVDTPLTGIVRVAAGIGHGLALDQSGNVWAWGYNFFGQLGKNSQIDSSYAVKVSKDSAGTLLADVTDIRAFGSSSMAKSGGHWYAWGDNYYGQLGIGTDGKNAAIIKLPELMSGL